LIERYNLRHTRHLISISRYVAKYFSRQLRPETQVYFVPNAIDDSFFNLPDTSNGQTILFAGRVILRKRVLDLVQAFAKIANQVPLAHLRLAGEYSSEPSYVKSVRDFIRGANLEDRVHLLGALPEESVLREFASCDVLVLPSAQETTPMVIAQVMAAGKPVIATPVGGVEEMVSDGKTGILVDVGDTDRVAATLLRLLGDPVLRARLGGSGRKFALEHYGVDTVAGHTFEVYRSVANASN
jgi:glycosyltransferase involved in cell wall biosynthesis